jgi:hypothetical protein
VYLFADLDDAEAKLAAIRQQGCDRCRWRWHELAELRPAEKAVPA